MDKDQRLKIARVVKLVRFSLRLGQVEFAKEHGLTQSTLSKLENGTCEITAGFYRELKKRYNIQEVEFDLGILDKSLTITKPQNLDDEVKTFYEIPAEYAQDCASSTRTCIPLIQYFKKSFGQKAWLEFLASKKFKNKSEYYFYDFNNLINIQFNLDLLKEILNRNKNNKSIFDELTSYTALPLSHGTLMSLYQGQQTSSDLIQTIVSNAQKYDLNTSYELKSIKSDKEFVLEVVPNEHLHDYRLYDENLGDFIGEYKNHYLQKFSQIGAGLHSIDIKLTEGYKKNKKWLYEINCEL